MTFFPDISWKESFKEAPPRLNYTMGTLREKAGVILAWGLLPGVRCCG